MTPNQTPKALSAEQIEAMRVLKTDGRLDEACVKHSDQDILCDMALKSLKAPAVTTGGALKRIGQLTLEADACDGGTFECEYECAHEKELRRAIDNFLDPPDNTTLSAPAPLSSEAVVKVREALFVCEYCGHEHNALHEARHNYSSDGNAAQLEFDQRRQALAAYRAQVTKEGKHVS